MKVILDTEHQPGIFIPLAELSDIDTRIAELFQLREELSPRSVFDISVEEINQRLEPNSASLASAALSKGAYLTYRNTDKTPAKYINEYADQTIEHVNVNRNTGKDRIIKTSR
jgi:hypothetical protein